jgi:uncharacterized protein YycO
LPIFHLDFNSWQTFPFLANLVTKATAVEEETTRAVCLYHQYNTATQCDCVIVTSLSASLLQKRSVAADHLCQKVLNWNFLRKIEKRRKFFKACKSKTVQKRNCVQWDLPSFPVIKITVKRLYGKNLLH